jgi:hypothetical protein
MFEYSIIIWILDIPALSVSMNNYLVIGAVIALVAGALLFHFPATPTNNILFKFEEFK